ncbi:hypothetical protein ABES02_29355 [Neobacillus pocheonensis]|uniref:hypothetical protein n=1 Tax=Neobacillus pocheonensis TaxID=363869 RepID=UPI003D289A12
MNFEIAKWIFYTGFIFLYIYAAFLLRKIFHMDQFPSKESLLQRLKYQNLKIKDFFITEELEKQFIVAGSPFGLNAKKFQTIRYVIFLLAFGVGIYRIYTNPELDMVSKLLGLAIPVIFLLVVTNPKKKSMKSFFKFYQGQKEYFNNQELFLLYSMITDELKESKDQTVNILDLLRKLRQYTPRIRPSINKGLRQPKIGINAVMDIIGRDIGTEEAIEVCKIIAGLNSVDQQNLHELIANRENSYVATLRGNRQKGRMRTSAIVNTLVFIPLIIYMLDILYVVMQMIAAMGSNLNNLK